MADLLLILMEWGYSLFQIGVLQSITFAFTYFFEVPSGLIADHFGKTRRSARAAAHVIVE